MILGNLLNLLPKIDYFSNRDNHFFEGLLHMSYIEGKKVKKYMCTHMYFYE